MIAFASLWLGLVTGAVPVELLADTEVARVELRLDGEPCAELTAPPWTGSCELGRELAPHELTARAFAADGTPLGEAQQWLNLPREPAELEVALAAEPGPPPRLVARLAWAGPGGVAPVAVRATLDGEPLAPTTDLHRLEMPPPPRGAARLLRVEVDFPGDVTASRELAVGGDVVEQISEELTAVPVEVHGRTEGAVLREGDDALPVVTFEKGDADLVAVIDPGALPMLETVATQGSRRRLWRSGGGPGLGGPLVNAEARASVPLPDGARLRLVWPVASSRRQGELRYDLFPTSPARTAETGGLLDQLLLAAAMPAPAAAPRLADAVALAALSAAQPGRRRAVLLVVGDAKKDGSAYDEGEVRRFLARLRVPLVVWSTTGAAPAAWGEGERVTSVPRLEAAAHRLDALLGRQRIAWVEGRHLPQRLTVETDGPLRLATDVPASDTVAVTARSTNATRPPDDATVHAPATDGPAEQVDPASAEADPAATTAPPPTLPPALQRRPLPPFTLATDVGDERLLAAVAAVAAALPADFTARFGLAPPPAGTVLLFAREEEFRGWLAGQGGGDAGVEGFARGGVAALAVGHFPSEQVTALLVHELTHLLTRDACGRQLPPWLEEGLAEELAMSRRDAHGHTLPGTLRASGSAERVGLPAPGRATYELTLGGPAAALVSLVRGPRPALTELLAMPWPAFAAASGRPERYAASALFVRFLLDGEGGRWHRPFRAFLAAVAGGGAADPAALAAALGTPLAALQAPFDGWLRRTVLTAR